MSPIGPIGPIFPRQPDTLNLTGSQLSRTCARIALSIRPQWAFTYMSENILVVEYEPRYTDRVRQALTGQPFTATFARDGEEAIKALEGDSPRLIVLSSVVPKVSTTELIRAIRGRKLLQETPILLTVSGYNGKSPRADAQRVGASDILPKPYSEHEFLGKVQQMLGIRGELPPFDDFTVHPSGDTPPGLTSNDIFGD